jgi:serine/threonine protein kinase
MVWSKLDHPNIVPLFGITTDFDRPGLPCLVSPYYPNGDVMAYLKTHPEVNRVLIVREIGFVHKT